MMGKIDALSPDAKSLLDAMLLRVREQSGWGADLSDEEFLQSAHTLLDVGAIVFRKQKDGGLKLEPVV